MYYSVYDALPNTDEEPSSLYWQKEVYPDFSSPFNFHFSKG